MPRTSVHQLNLVLFYFLNVSANFQISEVGTFSVANRDRANIRRQSLQSLRLFLVPAAHQLTPEFFVLAMIAHVNHGPTYPSTNHP